MYIACWFPKSHELESKLARMMNSEGNKRYSKIEKRLDSTTRLDFKMRLEQETRLDVEMRHDLETRLEQEMRLFRNTKC